ncbi:MAG: hypothetical protein HY707_08805 [Ignavibacteriae bacterium]|nr:hypothetical protein [Ignavibacteriota bacterium]
MQRIYSVGRCFCLIAILIFAVNGCATTNEKSNFLNGIWTPVKQEMAGTSLPPTAFENQKLTLLDSTYTYLAESIDKGIVTYSKGKMDIYGKEGVNTGKHFTAIYKFENEQLTICYNLSGDSYPETFKTKGKPSFFLSVFKKESTK